MVYPDGNRFAIAVVENHQAWLWITAILSLMYSVVVLATRVTVKWGFFGADDLVLLLAHLCALGHWITVYLGLNLGLGKAPGLLGPGVIEKIERLVFVSKILLLLALGLAKTSVILFIRQLFTQGNAKVWTICTIGAAVMVAWTCITSLTVSVGCSPATSVQSETHCRGDIVRWIGIVVLDSLFELAILMFAGKMFAKLQMEKHKKAIVMLAFAFRVICPILFTAYVASYGVFLQNGRSSIDLVVPLVWQEILLCYALISTTIPVLKGFIGRFTTVDLVRIDQNSSRSRYGRGYGGSYNLQSLDSAGRSRSGMKLRPDLLGPQEQGITTVVQHDQGIENASVASFGSEQMIIHRKIEVHTTEG